MVIERKLLFAGSTGRANLQTIFDGGAAISLICRDFAEKLGGIVNLPAPLEIRMADGTTKILLNEGIRLDFYLNDLRLSDEFYVIEELGDEVLMGAPTLQKWHIQLDYEDGSIVTDPKVARMRV